MHVLDEDVGAALRIGQPAVLQQLVSDLEEMALTK